MFAASAHVRFVCLATLIICAAGTVTACSSDTSDAPAPAASSVRATTDSGSSSTDHSITMLHGIFANPDLATDKTSHDTIVTNLESKFQSAGDYGHAAMLGTSLLQTTENEYFALDQWNNRANMIGFYKDPQFLAALAPLYSPAPKLEQFDKVSWYSWGSLEAGDSSPTHYFVQVRGHLKSSPADAQAAFDDLAKTKEAAFKGAGDVAHLLYLGIDDPQEFLAVDVWGSKDNIPAVYTDPGFQSALGPLFDRFDPIRVHASTDWKQWSPAP